MDSIKVAVRVRPLLKKEIDAGAKCKWSCTDRAIESTESESCRYYFDHVYGEDIANHKIYKDLAASIVEQAMIGFNGTLFAYGQSGSGKTFTMDAIRDYSVEAVYAHIDRCSKREYNMRVAYMELYNENLFDLLTNNTLSIRETMEKTLYIEGLEEETITSKDHFNCVLEKGNRNRTFAATKQNDRSSRAHCIFRITIESRNREDENSTVFVSQINLVDLAGSERAGDNSGSRLREGCYINTSLLMLSQVIRTLSEGKKGAFINYRDSKLTRLLQNSLGGNSKTAILCTVSPSSLEETVSTLRFASNAKKVKTAPKQNEMVTVDTMLKRVMAENENLKRQLEEMKTNATQTKERGREEDEEDISTRFCEDRKQPRDRHVSRRRRGCTDLFKPIPESPSLDFHFDLESVSPMPPSPKRGRRKSFLDGGKRLLHLELTKQRSEEKVETLVGESLPTNCLDENQRRIPSEDMMEVDDAASSNLLTEMKTELEKLTERCSSLEKQLKMREEQYSKLQEDFQASESSHKDIVKDFENKIQNLLTSRESDGQMVGGADTVLELSSCQKIEQSIKLESERKIQELEKKIMALNEELELKISSEEKLKASLEAKEQEMQTKEVENVAQNEQEITADKKFDEQSAYLAEKIQELEALRKQSSNLEHQLKVATEKCANRSDELQASQKSQVDQSITVEGQSRIQELEKKIMLLSGELESKSYEVVLTKSALEKKEKELLDKGKENDTKAEQLVAHFNKIQEQTACLEEKNREIEALREQSSNLECQVKVGSEKIINLNHELEEGQKTHVDVLEDSELKVKKLQDFIEDSRRMIGEKNGATEQTSFQELEYRVKVLSEELESRISVESERKATLDKREQDIRAREEENVSHAEELTVQLKKIQEQSACLAEKNQELDALKEQSSDLEHQLKMANEKCNNLSNELHTSQKSHMEIISDYGSRAKSLQDFVDGSRKSVGDRGATRDQLYCQELENRLRALSEELAVVAERKATLDEREQQVQRREEEHEFQEEEPTAQLNEIQEQSVYLVQKDQELKMQREISINLEQRLEKAVEKCTNLSDELQASQKTHVQVVENYESKLKTLQNLIEDGKKTLGEKDAAIEKLSCQRPEQNLMDKDESQRKIQELEKNVQALTEESEWRLSVEDERKADLDKKDQELQKKEAENIAQDEQLTAQSAKLEEQSANLEWKSQELEALRELSSNLECQLKMATEKYANLNNELQASQKLHVGVVEGYESKVKDLQDLIEDSRKMLEEKDAAIEKLSSQKPDVESQRKIQELEKKVQAMTEESESKISVENERKAALQEIKQEVQKKEAENIAQDEQLMAQSAKLEEQSANLEEKSQELEALRELSSNLECQLKMATEKYTNLNNELQASQKLHVGVVEGYETKVKDLQDLIEYSRKMLEEKDAAKEKLSSQKPDESINVESQRKIQELEKNVQALTEESKWRLSVEDERKADLDKKDQELQKKEAESVAQAEQLMAQSAKLEEQSVSLEEKSQELEALRELSSNLESRLKMATEKYANLNNELQASQKSHLGVVEGYESKIKDLQDLIEHSRKMLEEKDAAIEKSNRDLSSNLESRLKMATEKYANLNNELQASQKSHLGVVEGYESKIKDLQDLIEHSRKMLEEKDAAIEKGNRELCSNLEQRLNISNEKCTKLCQDLQSSHESHNKTVEDYESRLKSLQDLIEDGRKMLEEKDAAIEKLSCQKPEQDVDSESQGKIQELEEKIQHLSEELELRNATESDRKVALEKKEVEVQKKEKENIAQAEQLMAHFNKFQEQSACLEEKTREAKALKEQRSNLETQLKLINEKWNNLHRDHQASQQWHKQVVEEYEVKVQSLQDLIECGKKMLEEKDLALQTTSSHKPEPDIDDKSQRMIQELEEKIQHLSEELELRNATESDRKVALEKKEVEVQKKEKENIAQAEQLMAHFNKFQEQSACLEEKTRETKALKEQRSNLETQLKLINEKWNNLQRDHQASQKRHEEVVEEYEVKVQSLQDLIEHGKKILEEKDLAMQTTSSQKPEPDIDDKSQRMIQELEEKIQHLSEELELRNATESDRKFALEKKEIEVQKKEKENIAQAEQLMAHFNKFQEQSACLEEKTREAKALKEQRSNLETQLKLINEKWNNLHRDHQASQKRHEEVVEEYEVKVQSLQDLIERGKKMLEEKDLALQTTSSQKPEPDIDDKSQRKIQELEEKIQHLSEELELRNATESDRKVALEKKEVEVQKKEKENVAQAEQLMAHFNKFQEQSACLEEKTREAKALKEQRSNLETQLKLINEKWNNLHRDHQDSQQQHKEVVEEYEVKVQSLQDLIERGKKMLEEKDLALRTTSSQEPCPKLGEEKAGVQLLSQMLPTGKPLQDICVNQDESIQQQRKAIRELKKELEEVTRGRKHDKTYYEERLRVLTLKLRDSQSLDATFLPPQATSSAEDPQAKRSLELEIDVLRRLNNEMKVSLKEARNGTESDKLRGEVMDLRREVRALKEKTAEKDQGQGRWTSGGVVEHIQVANMERHIRLLEKKLKLYKKKEQKESGASTTTTTALLSKR